MGEKAKSSRIFLSYARTDRELALALARELEKRGLKVWDERSLAPGAEWAKEIERALESCDAMIALLTEHSFSSSYVRMELRHAFFDERYKNRLLPVLIGGASKSDFSRLPWVLDKLESMRISEKTSVEVMARSIADRFASQIRAEGRE